MSLSRKDLEARGLVEVSPNVWGKPKKIKPLIDPSKRKARGKNKEIKCAEYDLKCCSACLEIKPLSINEAYQGRRFKTPKYNKYTEHILSILPPLKMPEPPYKIRFVFRFSNAASDFDNPVKPITDLLQQKYKFNDKLIMEAHIIKKIVPKGKESIWFRIEHYDAL